MKAKCPSWITTILFVVIGICLASCAKKATPVALAEYPTRIVGHWQGTVGSSKETMTIESRWHVCLPNSPDGFSGEYPFAKCGGKGQRNLEYQWCSYHFENYR